MTTRALLGPPRILTTAATVVRSLALEGPVATVTACWQEREPEDREPEDREPGPGPGRAQAHRDRMGDLAATCSLRPRHALASGYAGHRRTARADAVGAGFDDALRVVRGSRGLRPVVRFVNAFRARPRKMEVRYVEARDGHSWRTGATRLRDGLSRIYPGDRRFGYE